MGDVAWQYGSLALAAGLITFLVKWILAREKELRQSLREEVERERGISATWRQIGETSLANQKQSNEILWHVLDNQRHMRAMLERLTYPGTESSTGGPGWTSSEANRTTPNVTPWPR